MTNPTKITKTHWLNAGMSLLIALGPDSLSVAQLCQQVSRTKGSFYHHFKDHEQFLEELVSHWRQKNLHQLINKSANGSGQTRLSTLTALAAELNPEEEMAIRRLAGRHEKVSAAVSQVDEARMDYLALLYRDIGLKPQQAVNAAKIQYAGFVGSLSLWPDDFGVQIRKLGKMVDELLVSSIDNRF